MILCKCLKYFLTYICIFLFLNLSPCDSIFQMLCRNASNSIYCLKNSSNFVRACFRLDLNQIRISQIPFQVLRCVTCDQFSFGNNQDLITDGAYLRKDMGAQDYGMLIFQALAADEKYLEKRLDFQTLYKAVISKL